ncbi:hypothetical protein Fmac_005841 [Flemingia macrophylla]|uniref:Uncharacterized protein n=1 Tax=Flemingia macrophylla TaxID=520843 RepID=A0ABD1N8Y4_9FABA
MESELFRCDAPVGHRALCPLNSLLVGARMRIFIDEGVMARRKQFVGTWLPLANPCVPQLYLQKKTQNFEKMPSPRDFNVLHLLINRTRDLTNSQYVERLRAMAAPAVPWAFLKVLSDHPEFTPLAPNVKPPNMIPVSKPKISYVQATSKTCNVPSSQLPQPCWKGDRIAVEIP